MCLVGIRKFKKEADIIVMLKVPHQTAFFWVVFENVTEVQWYVTHFNYQGWNMVIKFLRLDFPMKKRDSFNYSIS
jgi:hypothetical protein